MKNTIFQSFQHHTMTRQNAFDNKRPLSQTTNMLPYIETPM